MKLVYFPIENYNRELSSRAHIAHSIHKNKVLIIYIDQDFLFILAKLRLIINSAILLKSVQTYTSKIINSLVNKKINLYLQDEESLMSFSDITLADGSRHFYSRNDISLLRNFRKIFCWTQIECNNYRNNSDLDSIPIVSGNMRTKNLVQKKIQQEIDSKCIKDSLNGKKIILFSSTFSQSLLGENIDTKKELISVAKTENYSIHVHNAYEKWREQNHFTFFSFMEFVRIFSLSSLANEFVILFRPHPSENEKFYKYIFQNIDSIVVNKDYQIDYWIERAELIIGSHCTTLIEAAVYGKPTISFLPRMGSEIDYLLSNSIANKCSFTTADPLELYETVKSLLVNREKHESQILKNIKLARDSVCFQLDTSSIISDNLIVDLKEHNKLKLLIYIFLIINFQFFYIIYNFFMHKKNLDYKKNNRTVAYAGLKRTLLNSAVVIKFRFIILSYS